MGDAENDWFRLGELRYECLPYFVPPPATDRQRIRITLIEIIETSMTNMVQTLCDGDIPMYRITKRKSWGNVRFVRDIGIVLKNDPATIEVDFISKEKKFALITYVLEKIHELLVNDGYSTKRDVFYQNPALFGTQTAVDTIIDDLSCLYEVPRIELRVLASSKGLIAGNLHFTDADGNLVNCLDTISGISVPTNVAAITVVQSKAKFILVVEKDATFQKILDGNFQDFVCPCIIITGKGYPDVNTREITRKFSIDLELPVFGLADCDPHGIEIICVYKYGSMVCFSSKDNVKDSNLGQLNEWLYIDAMSFNNKHLTIPWLKWIGIHTTDITRLGLNHATQPLTKQDIGKLRSLLVRPFIGDCPAWAHQMTLMQQTKCKGEIQILNEISADFMCRIFLPSKIRLGGWI